MVHCGRALLPGAPSCSHGCCWLLQLDSQLPGWNKLSQTSGKGRAVVLVLIFSFAFATRTCCLAMLCIHTIKSLCSTIIKYDHIFTCCFQSQTYLVIFFKISWLIIVHFWNDFRGFYWTLAVFSLILHPVLIMAARCAAFTQKD